MELIVPEHLFLHASYYSITSIHCSRTFNPAKMASMNCYNNIIIIHYISYKLIHMAFSHMYTCTLQDSTLLLL